ncbi:MAG: hypothetical protein O2822_04115 [Chloroflexi bacterium]|nr:hypothetical protein [Chloroflexota bacterium]
MQTLPLTRIWLALVGVGVISFAGCAAGALDCAFFRPLGLTAMLAAAAVTLFDGGARHRDGRREEPRE